MSSKRIRDEIAVVPLIVLLLAAATGCQLFPDRPEWSTKLFGKEEDAVLPTRMMVMWADTVLHQPQKAGVRGFGGRIYFYGEDHSDPVKVDGGLAVYAFDADDLNPGSAKPKRKYVFTADQFAEHMSQTSMGPSYSVWCPWDEVGGYNERLSLIVRFEGRNGGVVISDATVKLLPGLNRPTGETKTSLQPESQIAQASASNANNLSTQLAGFEEETNAATKLKTPRRQTQTIDLPPSFYRHLSGPAPQIEETLSPLESTSPKRESPETDTESPGPNQGAPPPTTSASRRTPYPRRTLGDKQLDASSEANSPHSLPSGWIPQLPKTPRYGYSKSRAE